MSIYNGKIGGPNQNTLEEDYLTLAKPKYQLTSKHNEKSIHFFFSVNYCLLIWECANTRTP